MAEISLIHFFLLKAKKEGAPDDAVFPYDTMCESPRKATIS
jgi:hypothetical protein